MIQQHFTKALYLTGIITMTPLLQFFFPTQVLGISQLQVVDPVGMLYAQHWGLLAFCFGALLVYAARNPVVRKPVVMAAGLEKLGLCALVLLSWNNPALQGLHPVLFIDGLCVILYAGWWATLPRTAT